MAIFSIFSVGTSFQPTSVLVYPMSKRLGGVYSVLICMLDRSVHACSVITCSDIFGGSVLCTDICLVEQSMSIGSAIHDFVCRNNYITNFQNSV